MSLDYQVFDPSPCNFPRPRVSVLPRGFEPAGADDATLLRSYPSLTGRGLHFTRGRYALGEAYRRAGLDRDGVLLAPAYHCVTMLDPALALGAEVRLYPLTADLAPDPAALDEVAGGTAKPVKALLATHFFGFARDFAWLKQWCDARGIIFVEDCSHTLYSERYQARGAGKHGQFIASSPYKFFPSADGGWLHAPNASTLAGAGTQPAGWLAELRGMKQCLAAARQPRVGAEEIARLDGQLAALVGQAPKPGGDERMQRPAQSSQYVAAVAGTAALRSSRWLIAHSSVSATIQRRQANYRRWLQAAAGLPNCRALYPELTEHVVPYMFPLYIDHPMPHFYWLKQLAVPVWRWDELAVSACPVAHDYRLHLLHLPCHQSLSDEEMDWLVAALGKVLRTAATGACR